jgi:hypothetical protein
MALNKSIEHDWIPAITAVGDLQDLRSRFDRVSMLSEIFAPLFSGLLLTFLGLFYGYLVIAIVIFLQYIPQTILLKLVQNAR